MQPRLIDLIDPYYAISIIGMAKNVGKTTVLNRIIDGLDERRVTVGLTSIGRDGESVDVVTKTEKPQIYVQKGSIIATALDLLKLGDITKEILMTTGINTPLGEVVVVRALSDGFVQLGGASINSQISDICNDFKTFGAQKVIVDGAISRKTLSSPTVTDATILCTGASMNMDIDSVVNETAHTVNMLNLPPLTDETVIKRLESFSEDEREVVVDERHVYLRGAISDGVIAKLITSNRNLENVNIVIDDASKIFIKERTFEKLIIKKANLLVRQPINLVAVTINPISAYGFNMDKDEFMAKICARVTLPVYNVHEPENNGGDTNGLHH